MSSGNNKLPLFDALPPAVAKEQLRELWHSVFGDGYEYIDAFFAAYRCEDVVHTLSVGGIVVSALYALPFTLCSDEKSIAAAYIYAVATAPEYRGKGYMALLMKNIHPLMPYALVSYNLFERGKKYFCIKSKPDTDQIDTVLRELFFVT